MNQPRRLGSGLVIALLAAGAFGMGGPFVKPLLEAGWSPGAAVLLRTAGATVILAIPALIVLRGRWSILRKNIGTFFVYGVFAVIGAQLFFYSAVQHMSVGIALLIEYLAPVFLVLFMWARTRKHPGWYTITGSVVALAGLVFVLDLSGQATPELIGVGFALAASLGVMVYYVISAKVDDDLPPMVLTAGSMLVGTVVLCALAVVGVVPLHATFGDVVFLGEPVSWLLPGSVILGMSTVAAYLLGIAGTVRLGTRIASFVGLTEVMFSVLASWLLLGELPAPVQFFGGALILIGVVLVRLQPENPAPETTVLTNAPTATPAPVATPTH